MTRWPVRDLTKHDIAEIDRADADVRRVLREIEAAEEKLTELRVELDCAKRHAMSVRMR